MGKISGNMGKHKGVLTNKVIVAMKSDAKKRSVANARQNLRNVEETLYENN